MEDKERAGNPKLVEDAELEYHSMKIYIKRKKNLQNHWELLNQPFPCIYKHWE